jgi:TRAP-type C4-dicarboxylate transport system permease small subunit
VGKKSKQKAPASEVIATDAADVPSVANDPFNTEITYPDDGAVASALRRFDQRLGFVEQVLLFAILTAVVLSASAEAIGTKIFHHAFDWSFDVVRDGVFSIAMLGAAFASHQQRHLAMDLLSKRLTPRGRLVLRVLLAIFTIGIVLILVRSGMRLRDQVAGEVGNHLIPMGYIAALVPIGAGLIILHTAIHGAIDVAYLVRRKLPPEKMRMGH